MKRQVVRLAVAGAIVAIALAAGVAAGAVTRSDVAYFDGFQDLSGLDATQTRDVEIDALGGLRMVSNGPSTVTTWTSTADFTAPLAPLGPTVGYSTLDAAGDALKLPWATFGFRRVQPGPVLGPGVALSVDGYGVGGMSVQRISGDGGKYYMWYAGVPENEYAQRIYLATSSDGVTWTKEPAPVLELGAPGSFDSRQLTKPSVLYDPLNTAAPFRMWYAAEDETSGSVGYATSFDGRTWTKGGLVLGPGLPGTADSYRVMQPCVVYDNGVYYMWYTADDSNNRRVAYATSSDGLTWTRGGVVFDVGTGNYSEGAFAPGVVKLGTETPDPGDDRFHMLFTGNKIVAGGDIQSKIINATSIDGLNWAAGNIAFSSSGSSTAFDGYNVSQPTILGDPADAAHPYKMWYVGNNPDANRNYHDRIGLAFQKQATKLDGWVKVPGPSGDPYYEAVLTLGVQSAAFDSMKVADLRPVTKPSPATGLFGFYTGVNARDFLPRIGVVESGDGLTWMPAGGAAVIGAGSAGQFDAGGVACPAPIPNPAGGWWVYHTSLTAATTTAASVPSIGLHSVTADLSAAVRAGAPVLAGGSGFDAAGQSDPSAVLDGSTIDVFYAGKSGGVWSLGRASTTTAAPATIGAGAQILAPTPGSYDAGGLRKPVAEKLAAGDWRLFYTAIDAYGVKRVACATSADGSAWTKAGLVLSPATDAYDFTEGGVEPSATAANGAGAGLYFTGADRFGWTRVGKVDAAGPGYAPSGSATYELDNVTPRDWRGIVWSPADPVPAGASREVWVRYYPTLSGRWSSPYRVANDADLPFLLTVQSMRWEIRMKSDAASVTPTLDQLSVEHAPIEFPANATAVTTAMGPIEGKYIVAWGELKVSCDIPGGSGLTLGVRDDTGAQVIAPQTVTGTSITIPLNGVALPGTRLTAVIGFSGDRATTAKVKSLTATYTSTSTPSQLTLTAGKTLLSAGGSTTLSGKLSSDPTPLDPTNGDTVPLAGQTVVIAECPTGATGYTDIGMATTGADGSFALPTAVNVPTTTSFRAFWAGANIGGVDYPPAVATVRVMVKPKVTLKMTRYNKRSGKYYLYKAGRAAYAQGAVTPNHAKLGDGSTAGTVRMTVYQYKSRRWVKVKTALRTLTATSTYAWSWRPRYKGTYRWICSFAGDVDHAPSTSPYRYVKVY